MNIKTKLHYYWFSIDNEAEHKKYNALSEKLKEQGLKVFDSICSTHSSRYKESIKPLNNTTIELETSHLFNNQWNTAPTKTSENGLRVFDWAEAIYPNKDVKEGMYLEQTAEMKEIRNNTFKCGYCGKQYYKPDQDFCDSCLGSEHLEESELKLLKLIAVSKDNFKFKYDTVVIPDYLIKCYNAEQKTARMERLKKRNADKLKSIEKDIENSKKEYDAFKWLIDHNIDVDNCIYYDHTDTFCFGWRDSLANKPEERHKLLKKLVKFPYKYDTK